MRPWTMICGVPGGEPHACEREHQAQPEQQSGQKVVSFPRPICRLSRAEEDSSRPFWPSLLLSDTSAYCLRAGLHIGECHLLGEKMSGIAVHIGARVMA